MNMSNSYLSDRILTSVRELLGIGTESIKYIGGGSFGKVFAVTLSDKSVIAVKAFRLIGAHKDEAFQLAFLSERTSVRMPEVLFTYSDEECALMGMSFIDGKNVLDPLFLLKSREKKRAFAKSVVSGMSEWHSVKNNKFGSLGNPTYDSWIECYRSEKQQPWLSQLGELAEKGKYSKKNYELLCNATEIFNKVCCEPESAVLIHGDLNIMNIMADPQSFDLLGFIDPNGSMWADREYDLFQLLNMWGNCYGLYDEYKKLNGLSAESDFRVAYYAAMNEASCRLKGGLIMPVWEIQCNMRLKKAIKKL